MSGRKVHYLIEFRFQGKARSELKKLIWDVDKRCRIGNARRKRPIPHITLVAPFQTQNERKLIKDFCDICSKTPLMKFTVKGFNTFEDNRVLYVDINPDEKLDNFRWELSKKIQPYCQLNQIDYQRKYYFHSTVAMKLSPIKFKQVKSYVQRKNKPDFRHIVMRVTLIKGNRILREYDFMQRKLFDRRLAKSRKAYSRSVDLLKKFFNGEYDPNQNIKIESKKSLWDKIKVFFWRAQ